MTPGVPGRRLRVGLVCPYSFDIPGGVQNQVRGLARYLRSQGHEACVLAPGDFAADGDGSWNLVEEESFTSAGAAVAVPYNGSVARVNFGPLSAGRVTRWLRRGNFDLIHIHEPITPSIAMLALWAADVPVVATFHTATPRSRSMQLAGSALRSAVEKIHAGIAVSESARKVVVEHLGRDAVVIPNGFCFGFFGDPVAELTSPPLPMAGGWRGGARPRLTFLGRVDEPRKGLDTLLAALPRVRVSFPDLEVVVAGRGSRALPTGCRAPGLVSDREKADLLATSDVFVAPHLARESFGIVLLEAMASGTAVVASDLPPFAEILVDDELALGSTFAAGSSPALAAAVCEVLRHPDPARTQAARRASRRYDWSVVGAAITEVYQASCDVARPAVRGRLAAR